jgi:hypothetical protein
MPRDLEQPWHLIDETLHSHCDAHGLHLPKMDGDNGEIIVVNGLKAAGEYNICVEKC